MDQTEILLKELTEASGIPGYEGEVRSIMQRHIAPLATVEFDRIGGIVGSRMGAEQRPWVMISSHMDEVGFMVRHISKEGAIRFHQVGGMPDQVILGQRVSVLTCQGTRTGVIGSKPPHLMILRDEHKKLVPVREMYVDIGATSAQEATKAGVRIGDPIVPVSDFTVLVNPRTYMAKAFDDRVACVLAIEALRRLAEDEHPNTLFVAGTVLEEEGVRGAQTMAHLVNPDVAIVLEIDFCGDVPGIEDDESSVKLGAGPSLLVYDRAMIPNLRLRDLVIDTAAELDIPLQYSAWLGGATDGGRIHVHRKGVPTVVIAVPTRHVHSFAGIIHRDDYDRTLDLLVAVIKKLDRSTTSNLTAW